MSDLDPGTMERFWLALGKFAYRYAEVESVTHEVLRIVSGTSVISAQALFSGTRIRSAMDHIKRIHEGKKEPLDPLLERAFSRLGEITTIRDRILHYGFEVKSKRRALVTDRFRVLRHRVRSFPITVADLDALEADVNIIHACLTAYWIQKRWPSFDPERLQKTQQHALMPWNYKLLSQARKRPDSRSNNREPPHQDQSL